MHTVYHSFACLLGSMSLAVACHAADVPADSVYRHGFVYTVDAKDSVHSALAVRDGKIL